MCGRFASAVRPSDAWLELMQEWSDELFNRYNVSPTSQIGAFVEGRCHAMRWGLIPSWSKQLDSRYATFNARLESIESKPTFRDAWRRNQKCLIPALGYYEWRVERDQEGKDFKQPYFVTMPDGEPLVFAGLYDQTVIGDASLKTCTIITTESTGELKDLHSRMPVMLSPDSAAEWLSRRSRVADDEETRAYMQNENRAARGDAFEIHAVDRRVNRSSEEGPDLVRPLE